MSLQVHNLCKKYGDTTVVDNLSFELNNPGVYALLGTNGAGKTTSIRMILGMLAKDGGEVLWKGQPLDAMKINVGYLAEERGLYPKYSLMDQLMYFAKLKGVNKTEAAKRIAYWAERLEVEEYLYPGAVSGSTSSSSNTFSLGNSLGAGRRGFGGRAKKVKPKLADQLSKGNQQKIQLMAALLSDPEILILDEPLSGLDPVNTDLFKTIIREEVAKGKYLIMSSHQMEVIEEFCEDITILKRGKSILKGNLNEIKKSYGRVNLFVKCDDEFDEVISKHNLQVKVDTPDGKHIKVSGEAQAREFLKDLLAAGKSVVKFELREPSLHEIFIEKAGDSEEETGGSNE